MRNGQLTTNVAAAALLAVAVGTLTLGCGANDEGVGSGPERGKSPSTTKDGPAKRQDGTVATERSRRPKRGADLLRGTTPVRTPGGGIVYMRPPPQRTMSSPSRACSPSSEPGPSERPPRPGVSATRLDARRILVAVEFERIPGRCAPDRVRLTIDVHRDYQRPAPLVVSAEKASKPFVVRLPERVRDADVIGASSIRTSSGTFSDSKMVRIVDSDS